MHVLDSTCFLHAACCCTQSRPALHKTAANMVDLRSIGGCWRHRSLIISIRRRLFTSTVVMLDLSKPSLTTARIVIDQDSFLSSPKGRAQYFDTVRVGWSCWTGLSSRASSACLPCRAAYFKFVFDFQIKEGCYRVDLTAVGINQWCSSWLVWICCLFWSLVTSENLTRLVWWENDMRMMSACYQSQKLLSAFLKSLRLDNLQYFLVGYAAEIDDFLPVKLRQIVGQSEMLIQKLLSVRARPCIELSNPGSASHVTAIIGMLAFR